MATRPSIRGMTDEQVTQLRKSYAEMMAIDDDRGYSFFAGLHGLPLPIYCQHGTLLFLPWHRAYLYFFELAIQDRVEGVGVPWWDWTSDESHVRGIPASYAVERTPQDERNPLASAEYSNWPQDLVDLVRDRAPGLISADDPARTVRDPDSPDELPSREAVSRTLSLMTFEDFSQSLENLHGAVHVWVGGSMSAVPAAAYDPIFWSHHSMVDRLWYLWQIGPNGVLPPENLLDVTLTPFPMTVRETLSIERLGYDYAVQSIE